MRLRDVGTFGGLILALCASVGCSHNRIIYTNNDPPVHVKSPKQTPQMQADNEVGLAQEYIQQQQYETALDHLQKAIKLDPSSYDAYTMLGVLDERINRLDEAETAYAKSVKLAPNKGAILNNYGAWLCRSGHPAESDAQFHKAIADPFYKTPAVAISNAASCAMKAGKPALAEGYDRQILGLDPNNADALQTLAGIDYQRGDYLHARGFAERLLANPKAAPESLDLAAHIEDKLGDTDTARAYRGRLSTEFPQYAPQQF